MTDVPENPWGSAMMQLRDKLGGFVDLAAGARRQLVDAGFSPEHADAIASEFTVEAIRMAFASVSGQRRKPPSLLDLLRRPPEK